MSIGTALPWPLPPDFDEPKPAHEGWGKANRHYWLADYRGWVEFFISQVFTEHYSALVGLACLLVDDRRLAEEIARRRSHAPMPRGRGCATATLRCRMCDGLW